MYNLTSNEEVVLAVKFRGRDLHGLMITWMHNGIDIATDPRIHNTFNSEAGTGRTELRLAQARRSDAGMYHVRISNQVGPEQGTPTFTSQDEATLQLNITGRANGPLFRPSDHYQILQCSLHHQCNCMWIRCLL